MAWLRTRERDCLIVDSEGNPLPQRPVLPTDSSATGEVTNIGSQIGIYNPRGEKVGVPGHRDNTEYVFVVADCAAPITRTA